MDKLRRHMLIGGAIAGAGFGVNVFAAPEYPVRPVKVIIPYPPGGPTDIVGRIVCTQLSEIFKQPFSIENKPGASGMIGADMVAKAAPDGYTILINVSGQIVNPFLYKTVPHDPLKDFAPITNLASTAIELVVSSNSPAKTVKELIEMCKAEPGKYSFASSSNGTPGHLMGELFKSLAKIDVTHVPYKGSAPALTDVIGGQVAFMFDSMPSSIGLVTAGKLRSLGVTSQKRLEALPNVPTFAEVGLAPVNRMAYYGLLGPAGMSKEAIDKIHAGVQKVLQDPAVRKRIEDTGSLIVGNTPDQFAAEIKAEYEIYKDVVSKQNLNLN